MPSLNPFKLGRLKSAASLFIVTVFCCLSLPSAASVTITNSSAFSAGAIFVGSGPCCSSTPYPLVPLEPGFTFTYGDSGDITVDHPNGVTVNTLGNTLEFTSGDSTSSITFSSNTFTFSILTPLAVLVSNFDATGISIDGGDEPLRFEGPVVAHEIIAGSSSLVGNVLLASSGSFTFGTFASDDFYRAIDSFVSGDIQVATPIGGIDFSPIVAFVAPTVASQPPAVITLADATQSVASTANAGGLVLSSISTVLNGAHSRPLSRLVAKGEKTGWVAGDLGVDHHDSRDGDLGLAEVGFGYHFGRVQMNIALGKTWSDQDTFQGGSINADGKFVMVEGIIPVTRFDGLHATITGYGHWGDVDVKRGYLNAGLPDFSTASPDSRTWGLRARLDWQNALSWNSADFTPYLGLSFSDSHLDSFTETGGAFPARFDSRDEEVTELRVGANSEYPLFNNRAKLLGNLEVAHRFDDQGSQTSGELIGLFGFDLPGQDYDQDWIKAGIGIEGELGKGKASLMLNGTTEGEMPSAWAAFSYQVAF